jgi:putative transcriptional regulator
MIKLTLDRVLKEKGITRYELSKRTGILFHIVDRYYKNQVVRYDSYILNKICDALDCDVADLVEYTKESN